MVDTDHGRSVWLLSARFVVSIRVPPIDAEGEKRTYQRVTKPKVKCRVSNTEEAWRGL